LLSLHGCVKVAVVGGDPMFRLLLAAAIVMPCFGCASVTRGTTENISIATTPAGATADISGLEIPTACVTPCVVQAKRNADITVTINKEGYQTQTIPLTKEIPGTGAAGFAGNLLLGGVVGMGVDAATGAAQDHKPNPVIVTLHRLGSESPHVVRPRPPRRPPPPQS
jgi:PEGA domain-containing protein